YSVLAHRYLHSFPTRRSSDLASAPCPPSIEPRHCWWARCALPTLRRHGREARRSVRGGDVVGEVDLEEAGIYLPGRIQIVDRNRSEEHTSELQSRGHLVCRLL